METLNRIPGYERYVMTVDEYSAFRRDGFLIARGVVPPSDIEELIAHTEDLMYGRVTVPGVEPPPPGATPAEIEKRLLRIHMLHRELEIHERVLLHPRVLDIVEALIGPDVSAMQTMLFIKAPGADGQGWHQDTYYIPTFPDTLIGAWIALDRADIENGCMWMARGSQNEPVYPPAHGYGYGDFNLKEIHQVSAVGGHSNTDEDPGNSLWPIANKYRENDWVPVILEPGDVAFFGGHILHRSLSNKTPDRFRRAFVSHYSNARSFNTWDEGNHKHILARGNTTLPFAKPKFGTPCAALNPQKSLSDRGATPTMMMATKDGTIEAQEPALEDHED